MNANYLSDKSYSNSCNFYFSQPYKEGFSNFKISSQQGLSAFSQIKHLCAGFALITPLINTVVFIILRKACEHSKPVYRNKKIEVVKLLGERKSFDNLVKNSTPQVIEKPIEPQNSPEEKQKPAILPNPKPKKSLPANSRDYHKKWDTYLRHQKIKGIPTESQSGENLPFEDLLLYLTTDNQKVLEVPIELFRDAALSYKSIGSQIVLMDSIWNRFIGHTEYLEDIFNTNPSAALCFVASERVKETLKESLHRAIILSASQRILEQLEKDRLELTTMQKFIYFCMIYRPAVPQDIFKMVKNIQQKIKEKAAGHPEKEDCKKFLILVDLLVERYELQGVISHKSAKPKNFDTPCSSYLLDAHWNEISHHFTDEAQKDENFDKKLAYFSLLAMVPKANPYYASARKILGNIARAQGNFDLSELHFSEAESYS